MRTQKVKGMKSCFRKCKYINIYKHIEKSNQKGDASPPMLAASPLPPLPLLSIIKNDAYRKAETLWIHLNGITEIVIRTKVSVCRI